MQSRSEPGLGGHTEPLRVPEGAGFGVKGLVERCRQPSESPGGPRWQSAQPGSHLPAASLRDWVQMQLQNSKVWRKSQKPWDRRGRQCHVTAATPRGASEGQGSGMERGLGQALQHLLPEEGCVVLCRAKGSLQQDTGTEDTGEGPPASSYRCPGSSALDWGHKDPLSQVHTLGRPQAELRGCRRGAAPGHGARGAHGFVTSVRLCWEGDSAAWSLHGPMRRLRVARGRLGLPSCGPGTSS